MSRHQTRVAEFTYAWGYDRMLQSYFYQKFDHSRDDPDDAMIFSIDSSISEKVHPDKPKKPYTGYSNGEILELMEKDGVVPEEHLELIALDLPIP